MKTVHCAPAIIIAVILTASVILIICNNRPQDIEEFNCQAQLSQSAYTNNNTGETIRTNAFVTVFLTKKDGGFFSMAGTIENDGVIHDLRRVANFSISQETLLGMRKIIIKSVDISPSDNTPDKIWNDYVVPEKAGIPLYVKLKKINSNTIIINSLSLPYLMCVMQKN
ncbi:FidL-like protein [Serratia grimesii]|uniref:FidL-like protein n=1 Tax=Serratia grimesii TaxID=82995 RepID=UPI00383B7BAF